MTPEVQLEMIELFKPLVPAIATGFVMLIGVLCAAWKLSLDAKENARIANEHALTAAKDRVEADKKLDVIHEETNSKLTKATDELHDAKTEIADLKADVASLVKERDK